jgi:hypothetical protein
VILPQRQNRPNDKTHCRDRPQADRHSGFATISVGLPQFQWVCHPMTTPPRL